MQRSRTPLYLALITFVLALIAGGYAYNQFLRTVPALIAVQDVPAGAELTREVVRVIRVPAGGTPPQALFGPGQITGMYAAVPLFADQIITARHITDRPPEVRGFGDLRPGQRIISVPVRAEAVLGGALRPGDLVDVVAAWSGDREQPAQVQMLAAAVRVVDVRNAAARSIDAAAAEFGPDGAVPSSVLLQVSGEQAQSLVAAVESKATLYLWLAGRDHP